MPVCVCSKLDASVWMQGAGPSQTGLIRLHSRHLLQQTDRRRPGEFDNNAKQSDTNVCYFAVQCTVQCTHITHIDHQNADSASTIASLPKKLEFQKKEKKLEPHFIFYENVSLPVSGLVR